MTGWLGRSFHRKLVLALSLTSLVGIALTSFLLGGAIRRAFESELTLSLTTTASIVNAEIDRRLFASGNGAELQRKANFLAEASGARVTFVANDGTVLGDSSLTREDLANLDNHANRPEIRSALDGKSGASVRLSNTVNERMLYVAVPARSRSGVVGAVRTSVPLTEVEKKIAVIQRRTALVTLGVFVVALLVALWLASSISRPVTEMSEVARRLAAGDYAPRIRTPASDELGRLAGTMNLLAERVQSKVQELSHDKAQLGAILANMSEAVVAADATGRIIAVNPALSRTFDVAPDAAEGRLFLEVLRHHQLDRMVKTVLEDRKPAVEEIRTFTPDERTFDAHAVPLMEEGAFAGVLVVLHDITRLRQLEQVRRDFVANVSHELRTPLASIKGFAETLEMGAMDDPKIRVEFLQSIQRQADRMTALVEDLLDLAAIESGRREPDLQSVPLGELLDDVVAGLRPVAARRLVAVSVAAPSGLPDARGDRPQLRQVFANLVENAIKFNREGGAVTVTAAPAGDRLEVRVADTGSGIPAEDLPRVFERFYRVDKARSRDLGGTGLGLSIVKHLVEAHGGSVSVESEPGKGATFTVLLPASK